MQDTLGVSITSLSDSLRAILGSVHVTDTLRAILSSLSLHVADTVRIASPPEGWSPANVIAGLALFVSVIFSLLLFRLQRAQNQMVERHERERRDLEAQIHAQQTHATDQRIGWVAFKLARQLQTWVDEPIPHSGGRLASELITEFRQTTPSSEGRLALLKRWASRRCAPAELKPAEDRAEVLMDNAVAATKSVGPKAMTAFQSFHEAVGRLNRGLVQVREEDSTGAQQSFVQGYAVLLSCIEQLTSLIPVELRDQFMSLPAIPSSSQLFAPGVSTEPPASADPAGA